MNTNISTAHKQYVSRPADERFFDLQSLISDAAAQKARSAEVSYNLKDLQAQPINGGIILASPKGPATLSHHAFGQLARTIGAPAAYLRSLPSDITAQAINHGLKSSPVGTAANILVEQPSAEAPMPMIRACTSEKYGRLWDASLIDGANAQIFQGRSIGTGHEWKPATAWDGKPSGMYRGDRDSFVLQIDGGSIVTDPSARFGSDGQMYRGIMIRNSEVGLCSVTIECVLFRFICGNLMLWGATIDRKFRRRHVGKTILRDVLRELGTIAHQWSHRSASQDEAIIKGLISHEIAATKEAVVDELMAMGSTKETATSAYDRCVETESLVSPRSYWGIAQGLTRDSQMEAFQDSRYELDQLAAKVLARGAKLVAA